MIKIDIDRLPILVPSYDGCSDIWPIFIDSILKNWPSHTGDILIGSETIRAEYRGHKIIPFGENAEYSSIIHGLADSVKSEWIILGVDDFPLSQAINRESFESACQQAWILNADFVHLLSMPLELASLFEDTSSDKVLTKIQNGFPYSVALGFGIWKASSVKKIIPKDHSGWQIERRCPELIKGSDFKLFRLGKRLRKNPPAKIINLIQSRMWTREGLAFCKSQNPNFLQNSRSIEKKRVRILLSVYEHLRFSICLVIVKLGGSPAKNWLSRLAQKNNIKVQN